MGTTTASRTTGARRLGGSLMAVAACGAALLVTSPSHAGGLYFSERGVRPLGRGGAFTAGADDLGAAWHNPAGIAEAGSQFLFDASWLHFTTDYTRRSLIRQVDPNTGQTIGSFEQTFPTVEGASPVIPIPTLGASFHVHPDWTLAVVAMAPYAAISSYPDLVDGQPAPQRYGLLNLEGSALAVVGAWAGYRPSEEWSLGLGVQVLAGRFVATTMFSGCIPERFFCATEDPDWDTLTQLSAGPIVTPSFNLGAIYKPHRKWRIGGAFQFPFFINAPAEISVRLPATPVFETVTQDGSDGTVSFELPWSLRLGVEYRPVEDLRVELAGSYEGWSMHDTISFEPDGIALRNVVGFPDPYLVPSQDIPRNFQDTVAARLGGEYFFHLAGFDLVARGGGSFESSAVPDEYLSVLTIDIPKLTVGLGLGLVVDEWRFDMVYAHVFGADGEVSPDEARMPQLTPVQAQQSQPHYINGGTYQARANVVGIGLSYDFDWVPEEERAKAEAAADAQEDAGAASGSESAAGAESEAGSDASGAEEAEADAAEAEPRDDDAESDDTEPDDAESDDAESDDAEPDDASRRGTPQRAG